MLDLLHRRHHRRNVGRHRCLDFRPPDMEYVAQRSEGRPEAAIRLRHQVDAWLRGEPVVVLRDACVMQCRVHGMGAGGHACPEPEAEILLRIEPRTQRLQPPDLLLV
ncbi:hypothetical protein D3C81_1314560 [compost metagenome]